MMNQKQIEREVREVPPGWRHPMYMTLEDEQVFRPLYKHPHRKHARLCAEEFTRDGHAVTLPTKKQDHMPAVKGERYYQLYETQTVGTPMSPVFGSRDDLLMWAVSSRVSLIGDVPGTIEDWKKIIFEE